MDFIIPCHPKDFDTVKLSVDGLKNITKCSRIFIISKENIELKNTLHIPENLFDKFILKNSIKKTWNKKNKKLSYRSKWIYQQFLKLLCHKVIDDISESYVLVDSDTIFLKNVEFDENLFYYSIANEYHIPYLNPIKKILNIENTIGFSTINHHMIFNKEKMNIMINEIENRFEDSFVNIVLKNIDYNESSCFSEWDLYSNYMIFKYPELSIHRQLKWVNIPFIPTISDLNLLKTQYDFISCHAYDRGLE